MDITGTKKVNFSLVRPDNVIPKFLPFVYMILCKLQSCSTILPADIGPIYRHCAVKSISI